MDKPIDDAVIVIMLKDKSTGFLEKELLCCKITASEELLLNAFAEAANGDDVSRIVLRLTCPGEISDEDFDSVYDFYDETVYDGFGVLFKELEDCFNPSWEISFDYEGGSDSAVEEKINALLKIHEKELASVFEAVGEIQSQ